MSKVPFWMVSYPMKFMSSNLPVLKIHKLPDHVFKLTKALYGLKQAPRAWYDRLTKYLLDISFTRGKVDTTLFLKTSNRDILLIQIYVDDIIFGATNEKMCEEFVACI